MKDALGQEVQVGDTVAVIRGRAGKARCLKEYTVMKLTPFGVTVGDEYDWVKPSRFVKIHSNKGLSYCSMCGNSLTEIQVD